MTDNVKPKLNRQENGLSLAGAVLVGIGALSLLLGGPLAAYPGLAMLILLAGLLLVVGVSAMAVRRVRRLEAQKDRKPPGSGRPGG